MLTRCPACATHFRVTAEQLKLRSGRVRCGACQHVFNALDSLIEEPVMIATQAVADVTASARPTPRDPEPAAADPHAAGAVPPAPTPETPAEKPAPIRLPQREIIPEPAKFAEIMAAGASDTATAANTDFLEPPPPPRRWPWLIGSLAALAALVLQAALAFRVELALLWPPARPALVTLCQYANCEVGLPAKVALVSIEASDLHPDNTQPGRLALAATLKNRAPFAQQFPHLELTLTDTADQAVARKVLTPADYLPAATSIASGMPPHADIVLAVGVEPRDLAASGYRLYVFYP